MSLFSELKRRNVYKVAVAHAVVSRLIIQVATRVFPFFEAPNWAARPEQSLANFETSISGFSDGYQNWLWLREDYSRKARQNPAFRGFAKRIGLVDYWKQNRWHDHCQPAPEKSPDAFTCQ
jgi:hypothetical protein